MFVADPQPPAVSTPSRYRILVAEDNPLGQKVTMSLLGKGGYACDLAENGQEVLDALERTPYHLILMDCQMPVMDGYEATRRIRAMDGPLRAIPIVAMTANAFKEDRDACMEAGMNEFLSKPVRKQKLFEVIQHFLRDEFGNMN